MPVDKKSLSEKISELINPNPVWEDPENDFSETTAKVVERVPEDYEDDGDVPVPSSLKLSKCELLDENDVKYSGKLVSRRSFEDGISKIKGLSRDVDDSDVSEEENDDSDQSKILSDQEEDGEESEEGSESPGDDSEDEEIDDDDDASEGSPQKDMNISHILKSNFSEEVEKGNAVRAQIKLWDNLLEARIQLQKCLVASNKFPQHDSFKSFKQYGDSEFNNKVSQCKKDGFRLLDKLLEIQGKMMLQYPETQKIISGKTKEVTNEDDEEIPSSDEDNIDEEPLDKHKDEKPVKRRGLRDFSDAIEKQHNQFRDYRNSVLEKWYTRSKVVSNSLKSSNFSAFDMSVVKQIDHVLSDKDHLIRRTQKRRSEYQILGKPAKSAKQEGEPVPKENDISAQEELNQEIYDDDDFYHKLLRELIERKAADVTDPVQLGRQWTELQKLRKKLKKKVDTKASKGRKIRYVVHSKLVNFMAPLPNNWNDSAMDDLFRSLFGKSE
ncbi:protein AATF [Ischnura elegans]|uniref:protein AATF n=1 Tax=Ischnura elegans TaxID=197161 RepID=UPI001ED8B955|nr:protein AATF [Ischnura elegans]